jgi:hypothetical protein
VKLPTLVSLLLGLAAPAVLAQLPPDFALVVNGGLLWGGGLDRDLKFRAGGAEPRVVWPGTPHHLVRTTKQLVLSTAEGLVTLDPATWKETAQPVEGRIVALAATGSTALAFDSKHRVWRWQEGGQWTTQDSGLGAYDSVAALAAGPGGWVAAGSDRWGERRDAEGEETHPPATWYPSSRIWWSADGLKWTAATLPGQDDGGTQRIEILAGGPAGFLALTTGAEVFFSADGRTWRPGTWPEGLEPGTLFLHPFAGAFWLLGKDTHGVSTALWRTPDGSKWERLPVAAGAALAALLMKDGQVQALGYRKAGRALEVATLADFAVVPPPNAAEIAAAGAAEEKARLAAAERLAAARKAQAEKNAAEERAQALLPKPITDPAVAARMIAATETFERQFRSARSWPEAAPPAVELIGALERELPAATANAYAGAIIQLFFARGDFSAYLRLMTLLPARRAAMAAKLHESWRGVFDRLTPLPFAQWRTVGDWATWQKSWPGQPRAAAATAARYSGWLDVARTRRAALADCDLGACFDLAYAAFDGADVPPDADLFHFWRGLAAAMNPTRVEPILKHTQNGPPYFRDLAAVGSAWGRFQLALTLLPADRTLVPPGEARDLLQKAVAQGYTRAQIYLDWRDVRAIAAPSEPVPLPRLDLAAVGRMPDGRAIHELPEYAGAITRLDQLAPAIAVLNRGIEHALAGPDPLALTRHLASFARQWQAAVALAQKDTSLRLPPSPVHGTLSQAATKAWTEGRFGTALLAWLARDRYLELMSRSGEREFHINATGEFGWATWRRQVAEELARVMPALEAGGIANGHDALPPWSPVMRHPAELFTTSPRPVLEAGKWVPFAPVKAAQLPRLQRNPSEVRLATLVPSPPATAPAIAPREYREVAVRIEQPTPDYARLKKEHETQLAKLPADIARLEERVRREVPMITEVIGTRRVQTGTERVQTTRQGMPYDRPGVQQGSTVVTGSYDRPVYQTVTDTRTFPDKNHPLVKELERLKRELPALKAKPAPQPFTGRTEIVRRSRLVPRLAEKFGANAKSPRPSSARTLPSVERLLVALLANGHVLLEGMPGLAKTLLVKVPRHRLGVQFERIQFTPDLLPSDVVGTMIFQPKTGEFTPTAARSSPTSSSPTRSTAPPPRCRAPCSRACRSAR